MTLPTSLTEDMILDAFKAFLVGIVEPAVEVFRGQDNRVPEPLGATYIALTPMNRLRLATNADGYTADTKTIAHNAQFDLQLDIHGPGGSDIASVIVAVFTDDYGVDMLGPLGLGPLFASEGHQIPFKNGEDQYEDRWTMTLSAQIKPTVSTAIQSAVKLVPAIQPALGGYIQ